MKLLFGFAVFCGAYYALFWGWWWRPQCFINMDETDRRLGFIGNIVESHWYESAWYDMWHIPGHMLFTSVPDMIEFAEKSVATSDITVSINRNFIGQAVTVHARVIRPDIIVTLIRERDVEHDLKYDVSYVGIDPSGRTVLAVESVRSHASWVSVPRLDIVVSDAKLHVELPEEVPVTIVEPESNGDEAGENGSAEHLMAGNHADRYQNENISEQENLKRQIILHETGEEITEEEYDVLRAQLELKRMSLVQVRKHPLWTVFDTPISELAFGTPVLPEKIARNYLDLQRYVSHTEIASRVRGYEIRWPEPDTIHVLLENGGTLLISLTSSPAEQITLFQQFIFMNADWYDDLDYIDMRFGQKVYIKKK